MESTISTHELILKVIADFILKNNYSPTTREIMEIVGLKSPSTIHYHMVRLKKEGKIDYQGDGAPRTITVPGVRYVDIREKKDFEVNNS